MHQTVNRGKRSLTLDLPQKEGQEIFRKLAGTADVVVENFRPGTVANWGIGYLDLQPRNPQLVYVSISGLGQFGPESDQAGYDPIAQASSGWLSLNGEADGLPLKAPTFLADDLAGLHAAFSTLAAMGVELPRLGGQFMVAAPAGVFRCQDGSIMTGVLTDRHWNVLTKLIGRPELSTDPEWATAAKRVANRDEANALLQGYLATRRKAAIVSEFLEARLPVSAVRTYAEAAADPHVKERRMLEEIELEDGSIAPIVGPAAKLSRTPSRIRSAAPMLGRDNFEILKELGFDGQAMDSLRSGGVIGDFE
jgi:formyl-CoA transferase